MLRLSRLGASRGLTCGCFRPWLYSFSRQMSAETVVAEKKRLYTRQPMRKKLMEYTQSVSKSESIQDAFKQWDKYFVKKPGFYVSSSSDGSNNEELSEHVPSRQQQQQRQVDDDAEVVEKLVPDAPAYNALMSVLCYRLKEHHIQDAMAVYYEMRTANVSPTSGTFMVLFKGLMASKKDPYSKIKTIRFLLNEMHSLYNIPVTEDHLFHCLQALANVKSGRVDDSLLRMLTQMTSKMDIDITLKHHNGWKLISLLTALTGTKQRRESLHEDATLLYIGHILTAYPLDVAALDQKLLKRLVYQLLDLQKYLLQVQYRMNLAAKSDEIFRALHLVHDALGSVNIIGSTRLLPNPNVSLRAVFSPNKLPVADAHMDERLFAPIFPSPFPVIANAMSHEVHMELNFGKGNRMFDRLTRLSEDIGVIGVEQNEFLIGKAAVLAQTQGFHERLKLFHGDWLDVLNHLPAASVSRIHATFANRFQLQMPVVWAAISSCLVPGGRVVVLTSEHEVMTRIAKQVHGNIDLQLALVPAKEIDAQFKREISVTIPKDAKKEGERWRVIVVEKKLSSS